MRGLGVEAGYRHWTARIKDGDVVLRVAGGGTGTLSLKEVSTTRGESFFGLYYRF